MLYRIVIPVLILLSFSCKKEEKKVITISGTVINANTGLPIAGIRISLERSESLKNDGREKGIVANTYSDQFGNYVLTSEISCDFNYSLYVNENINEKWLDHPQWGIIKQIPSFTYIDPINHQDFELANKAEIAVEFNFIQPYDTNDIILLRFYKSNNAPYYFDYISSPGPDPHTIIDLSDYYLGTHATLMDGSQRLECYYTHQGNDTTISKFYTLIAGQETTVTIDFP